MNRPDIVFPLASKVVKLKNEFIKTYSGRSFVHEIIPIASSENFIIDDSILTGLHGFAENNPIYFRRYDTKIFDSDCRVYEGDINEYWLSSKKHDTNYQPFYPTWILSAFALAKFAKDLGFNQIIDIGSGDGRIAYSAMLLGMDSIGIEIDESLADLQKSIFRKLGMEPTILNEDATRVNFDRLALRKPMFFISGLPEMGEMLAQGVVSKVKKTKNPIGFNFMGSHIMKKYSRDQKMWGWSALIEEFDLELIGTITLPTNWTTDNLIDTAYVYTKMK